MSSVIQISDRDYLEILVELGYPVVKEADLEFSRDDIQNLFIYPAMREYFTWFPSKEEIAYQVGSSFEIPFPDENTYGIVNARLNTRSASSGITGNPFINELNITQVSRGNAYGTGNDYGFSEAIIAERSTARALLNNNKAFKVDVDSANRKIKGYTNTPGEIIIVWSRWSDNFEAIPYNKKSEVLDLAKAKTLKGFAILRSQLDADMGPGFDTGIFEDRAKELEERTLKKWKTLSKVVLMRN